MGMPGFAGEARGSGIDETPYGVTTNIDPPAEPGALGFPGLRARPCGLGGRKLAFGALLFYGSQVRGLSSGRGRRCSAADSVFGGWL
jgi:hypothetical protein